MNGYTDGLQGAEVSICLDEPTLLTQCVATVGCDNVDRNFTGNFPVSFQAVAVRNLLFLS